MIKCLAYAFQEVYVDIFALKNVITIGTVAIDALRQPFHRAFLMFKFLSYKFSEMKICIYGISHFVQKFAWYFKLLIQDKHNKSVMPFLFNMLIRFARYRQTPMTKTSTKRLTLMQREPIAILFFLSFKIWRFYEPRIRA